MAIDDGTTTTGNSMVAVASSRATHFAEVVMVAFRWSAPVALVVSLTACASLFSHSGAPAAATSEITVDLSVPPARAREQIVNAFIANGLPVATSQPGVVEFHGARERGILGFDEVFARAVIAPLDCGTRVTLFGEETHYPNSTATQGTATRIGSRSTGRAREVWAKLEAIAAGLRGGVAATPSGHSN
jgi:hypothetical protein